MPETVIKFAPLSGALDVGFLTELGRRKLHVFGLDDGPIDIRGSFARAERQEVHFVQLCCTVLQSTQIHIFAYAGRLARLSQRRRLRR